MSRPAHRRRLLAAAGALAGALVLAVPAAGTTITDPNDVAGKLDLRSVAGTQSESGLLTVTIKTWGKWTNGVLPASGSVNRLHVLFDTDLDGATEYRARIVSVGGALVAVISGQGQNYEPLPVTRVSGTTVRFTFPADAVESEDEDVQVAARSKYKGSGCSTACKDRAPNSGWLLVPHT